MNRYLVGLPALLGCLLGICMDPAWAQQEKSSGKCSDFSDSFELYNPERWQEVLLLSEAPGTFSVSGGRLVLKTPQGAPCEMQIYSLFTFEGDFDIQADYDVSGSGKPVNCRFNTGLVLQTLGDEKSYKGYVAVRPEREFFFRSRFDRFGDQNAEKFKGGLAPEQGTLRLKREKGLISFWAKTEQGWERIHTFEEKCEEKLRVRFKVQTGGDEEEGEPCAASIQFDNFQVNDCERIVQE